VTELRHSRGHLPTSEPLPFGVYGEIGRAHAVRVSDPISPVTRNTPLQY